MRLITLHDILNPSQVVEIDADAVLSVAPFGSGSSVRLSPGHVIRPGRPYTPGSVGVHETPEEVRRLLEPK